MNVVTKLVRNSIYSGAARLWTAATTFFIMPFMVRVLGREALGVYQLLFLLGSYFAYADIGISTALTKFVAEYAAKEDNASLDKVVNTGFAFYSFFGLLGLVVSFALAQPFLHFLRIPAYLLPQARAGLVWIILITVFTFVTVAFRSVLIGLHRLDIINGVEVVVSIPILAATVWVLVARQGLVGLCVVQFAQYFLINALLIYYAIRLSGGIRYSPFRGSLAWFRIIGNYGWRTATNSVAVMFQSQTERVLLSRLAGVGSIALYSMGAKVVDVWKATFAQAFGAVNPAAAHVAAVGDPDAVRRLYERGTRFSLALVYPMCGWLYVIAPLFITAWLGPGFDGSVIAMRMLLIAGAANMSTGVSVSVARGANHLKPDLYAGAVLAASGLFFGLLLGHRYGYTGVLVATAIAYVLSSLTASVTIHRSFGWPIVAPFLRIYAPPLLASAVAALPLLWYNNVHNHQIMRPDSFGRRIEQFFTLGAAETLAFFAVCGGLIVITRFITKADVQGLVATIKGRRAPKTVETEPVPAPL